MTVLTDKINKKKILQADIKEIVKNPQQFEDFLDVLIAEYRNEEKKISWHRAKKHLKKSGKIK